MVTKRNMVLLEVIRGDN